MKILLLIVSACALFSGCGVDMREYKPLTNDEIIVEVNKCRDAKLRPQVVMSLNNEVIRVQCVPFEEK